ncbi:hypothetical protein [Streptomyces sp. 150FB]|uniref:hypothetical protein n=1 Tax=Streptomyces sp. 150FB TaxID=1576605 RepID=UPI001F16AA5D|nr:hypothetical protein [Streptomyces sp. 150FB]
MGNQHAQASFVPEHAGASQGKVQLPDEVGAYLIGGGERRRVGHTPILSGILAFAAATATDVKTQAQAQAE